MVAPRFDRNGCSKLLNTVPEKSGEIRSEASVESMRCSYESVGGSSATGDGRENERFLRCVMGADVGGGRGLVTVGGGFVKRLLLWLNGRENDTLRVGPVLDGGRLFDSGTWCPDLGISTTCGRAVGAWSFPKGKLLTWCVVVETEERVSGPTVLERRRPLLKLWSGVNEKPCDGVVDGITVAAGAFEGNSTAS